MGRGLAWLAVVFFLNSLASLFYYLRWIAPVYGSGDSVHPSLFGALTPARWSATTAVLTAGLSLVMGLGAGLIWSALT